MEENKAEEKNVETSVQEKKSNNMGIIIVLILIIAGLVAYIAITSFTKNNIQPQDDNVIDANQEKLYTMHEIELITFSNQYINGEIVEVEKFDSPKVNILYPVINGNDISIKNLNDRIKTNVDSFIKDYNATGIKFDNSIEFSGFIKEDSNGEKIYYEDLEILTYTVSESNDYLIIEESKSMHWNEGTVINEYIDTYSINKNTGKVISHEEVINSINNIQELKNSLINFIKEGTDVNFSDMEEEDRNNIANKVQAILEQNKFFITFEENGSYIFTCIIDETTHEYYYYDIEEKAWSIYW